MKSKLLKLLRACLGDASAQFSLAADNWLVPPDQRNFKRAVYWARRARLNGHDRAGALLGTIISHPDAPQPEVNQEVFLEMKNAAEAGDIVGQYSLGWAYEEGYGVPKDLQLALHWYTTAAANGHKESEAAVARLCSTNPDEVGVFSVPEHLRVFEDKPVIDIEQIRSRKGQKDSM